jgi:quercetin dioxygenase-like cupin family protein
MPLSAKPLLKNQREMLLPCLLTGERNWQDKISPFDNYVQIIDGAAELVIDKETHLLKLGNGIIIPAHAQHCFNAREKFKIISTIIKSGYEE